MQVLERRETFWFVAALIAVLCATTNLPWTLDDYDQAKQAFTSFEMVNEAHWLYQHTPNERIATKPPLVGWVSASVYGMTRNWDIAWRVPSLVPTGLLLVLLTRAATQAYGAVAGLLALSAGGLNMLTPRLATLVRTDMPLALVIFLIGLTVWRKLRNGEAWQTRDRLIVFALLTAAMLIKGPIVYAFLLPGIAAFEWWRRKRAQPVSAWCGWWPWLASLAVFATWVAFGIANVPGFYEQVVLREFAGRFDETVHRSQPIYFYIPHLLYKFAPWSLLLVGAAAVARRAKSTARPEVAWLLCWTIGALILMSLVPSKRVDRIYPIVPPLCLLVAAYAQVLTGRMRLWSTLAVITACLFATGYSLQKVIRSYRAGEGNLVAFAADVRAEAAKNGWRYEVIGGPEEGLLLYLRRTRFIKPVEAMQRWSAGELDALVVPEDEAAQFLALVPAATNTGLEASVTINGERRRYLLLLREQGSASRQNLTRLQPGQTQRSSA